MWYDFFKKDKAKARERLKIEMELALASIPEEDKYDPRKEWDLENQRKRHQKLKEELQRAFLKNALNMVPRLYASGKISDEEYKKFLLDETGFYLPKLIEDEKQPDN